MAADSPCVWAGLPHGNLRRAGMTFSLPGRPDQSVHLVVAATARAALTASHSSGETTATRFALATISAVGNCFLSSVPPAINFEQRVAGRIMGASNYAGSLESPP